MSKNFTNSIFFSSLNLAAVLGWKTTAPRARKDLSDGLFHDNIFGKAKMNALTPKDK